MSTEQDTRGVAAFVKQQNGNGNGAVYKVDPPFSYNRYWDESLEKKPATTEYVWVSATTVPFSGPETYIFACDRNGDVLDWGELKGSFRGGLDHVTALNGAGYEVV